MKSAFTHWANLEATRDDSSMNLNWEQQNRIENVLAYQQLSFHSLDIGHIWENIAYS